MRQQLCNLTVLVRGQALQHTFQIGIRFLPIDLDTVDQAYGVVSAFKATIGKQLRYKKAPCREVDVAKCYAYPALALKLLGWSAKLTLADMSADAWRWQSNNPNGYV